MGHTRWLTALSEIIAVKIARDLNASDIGTHYSPRDVRSAFEYVLRNM